MTESEYCPCSGLLCEDNSEDGRCGTCDLPCDALTHQAERESA